MRAHSSAVERPAHNRLVPGSNPGGPTKPAFSGDWQYRNAAAAAYLGSTVVAKKPANPEGRVPLWVDVRHRKGMKGVVLIIISPPNVD